MTTHDAPLTDAPWGLENALAAIESRRNRALQWREDGPLPWKGYVLELFETDIPRLIAEVRRQHRIITDMEAGILRPFTDY